MMDQYSAEHWAALAAITVSTPLLVWIVRRRGSVGAGWVLLLVSTAWALWDMRPDVFDVHRSLPLHLSDVARLTASMALITVRWRWLAPTYYWGLTLNLMSLLTPDLTYALNPRLEYVMYWFLHGAVFAVPIALMWATGMRPTWAWFRLTWAVTASWAAVTMTVNAVTGANYGYLNDTPAGASLLDAMGPWPLYLLVAGGVLAVAWAAMTWPWVRR